MHICAFVSAMLCIDLNHLSVGADILHQVAA